MLIYMVQVSWTNLFIATLISWINSCIHHFTVKLTSDKRYFNALYNAAYEQGKSKWDDIGTSLNLSPFDLKSIRENNSDDGKRFRAMLLKWFESCPNCYLNTFLDALKTKTVDLANCPEIEQAVLRIKQNIEQENAGNNRKRYTSST